MLTPLFMCMKLDLYVYGHPDVGRLIRVRYRR